MRDIENVFVVYVDYGLEGFGKPIRCFSTEELAALYVSGAEENGGARMRIDMLFLETPNHFKSATHNPEKEE
jgi:uncharacterized protein (UPF0303 family)